MSSSFLASPAILPHPLLKRQLSYSMSSRLPPPQTGGSPPPTQTPLTAKPSPMTPKPMAVAESTDWVASTLTRRFGLGAGLAWAGFLTAGVVAEQIKTRFEASQQEANTKEVEKEEEVVLSNGIRYYDLTVGGGASPKSGDLVVIELQGRVEGNSKDSAFVDTFAEGKRPLALVMGSRPYTKGMCEGVENALRSMRAGGKRRVVVPPALGFGDDGADLGYGVAIPPAATLEYIVQVDRVSVAPS